MYYGGIAIEQRQQVDTNAEAVRRRWGLPARDVLQQFIDSACERGALIAKVVLPEEIETGSWVRWSVSCSCPDSTRPWVSAQVLVVCVRIARWRKDVATRTKRDRPQAWSCDQRGARRVGPLARCALLVSSVLLGALTNRAPWGILLSCTYEPPPHQSSNNLRASVAGVAWSCRTTAGRIKAPQWRGLAVSMGPVHRLADNPTGG